MEQQNILDGNELQLSTCYDGVPPPEVVWFHNGTKVLESKGPAGVNIFTCNDLHIASLPANGGGLYTCKITNVVGTKEVNYAVQVRERSKLSIQHFKENVNVLPM